MASSPQETMRLTLDVLYQQLAIGWRDFMIAKYIQEARGKGQIRSAHGFFLGAYEACLDIACLNIAKVLGKEKQQEPANMRYLLNWLGSNPSALPHTAASTLMRTIAGHNKQLEGFQEVIDRIVKQRNHLAHIDRQRVNDPLKHFTKLGVLSEDDLSTAYHLALSILLRYYEYLDPSTDMSHLFSYWEDMIRDDVEFLAKSTTRH